MGSGQSSANGGGASADVATKTSYYELLGVDRQATDEEIKKAYRRKALELHPDRNYGNEEWATELFAEVQSAHQVLSDAQERAWYDSHEATILAGGDPAASDPAADGAAARPEHGAGLTSADDVVRLLRRFSGRVEYTDAPDGFFGFLRATFDTLAREEEIAAARDDGWAPEYPSFGRSDSPYQDDVRRFYADWMAFSTRKSFAWRDVYRGADAPDRRTRRWADKENARRRGEAVREFNDAVRQLVAFARKRDPRWAPNTRTEAERQHALKEMRDAQAARARAEREALLHEEVPEWTKVRDPAEDDDSDDVDFDEEHFECVACSKTFKSENQWTAHEKSKKHQKAVYALQKKMHKENARLGHDELAVSGSGSSTPSAGGEWIPSREVEATDVEETTRNLDNVDLEEKSTNGTLSHDENIRRPTSASAESEADGSGQGFKAESTQAGAVDPDHDNDISTPPVGRDSIDQRSTVAAPPKRGKAAQKRAKKAAKQVAADQEDPRFTCAACNAIFSSKTKLFQHIKQFGHAAPVAEVRGGGGCGKKKGRR